jgi:hypothetical protein
MLPQISITYGSCGMTASRSANTDGWSETAQSLWTLMASTKHEVRARHVALVTVAIAISCLYTNRPFGVRADRRAIQLQVLLSWFVRIRTRPRRRPGPARRPHLSILWLIEMRLNWITLIRSAGSEPTGTAPKSGTDG